MKKYIILFSPLLMVFGVSKTSAMPNEYSGDAIVVAIAGQSNASGRAAYPSPNPTDGLMYVLGDDFKFYTGNEPTDKKGKAVDPVNYDSSAKYSAGYSIAQELHKYYPGVPVVIANCAKGSTSITQWQPSKNEKTLFGACLKRINAAMSQGDLAFLYFYQGETDAQPAGVAVAPIWDEYFTNYVNEIHHHFGQDLPIIFAQIATTTKPASFPYWEIVKTSQSKFSAPNVTMIETSDLALNTDGVHLNTASQNSMAVRVVSAYCLMVGCGDLMLYGTQK